MKYRTKLALIVANLLPRKVVEMALLRAALDTLEPQEGWDVPFAEVYERWESEATGPPLPRVGEIKPVPLPTYHRREDAESFGEPWTTRPLSAEATRPIDKPQIFGVDKVPNDAELWDRLTPEERERIERQVAEVQARIERQAVEDAEDVAKRLEHANDMERRQILGVGNPVHCMNPEHEHNLVHGPECFPKDQPGTES